MNEGFDTENLISFKLLVKAIRSFGEKYAPEYFLWKLPNLEEIIANAEWSLDGAEKHKAERRDSIFYAEETGLVNVALDIKKYVGDRFGENSFEYGLIKDLEFKNPPDCEPQ